MIGDNVDDEVRDSSFRYGLQMLTDRVDVDPFYELNVRFQHAPRLLNKRLEATPGLLLLH
jgi:hypothetical protein